MRGASTRRAAAGLRCRRANEPVMACLLLSTAAGAHVADVPTAAVVQHFSISAGDQGPCWHGNAVQATARQARADDVNARTHRGGQAPPSVLEQRQIPRMPAQGRRAPRSAAQRHMQSVEHGERALARSDLAPKRPARNSWNTASRDLWAGVSLRACLQGHRDTHHCLLLGRRFSARCGMEAGKSCGHGLWPSRLREAS